MHMLPTAIKLYMQILNIFHILYVCVCVPKLCTKTHLKRYQTLLITAVSGKWYKVKLILLPVTKQMVHLFFTICIHDT